MPSAGNPLGRDVLPRLALLLLQQGPILPDNRQQQQNKMCVARKIYAQPAEVLPPSLEKEVAFGVPFKDLLNELTEPLTELRVFASMESCGCKKTRGEFSFCPVAMMVSQPLCLLYVGDSGDRPDV